MLALFVQIFASAQSFASAHSFAIRYQVPGTRYLSSTVKRIIAKMWADAKISADAKFSAKSANSLPPPLSASSPKHRPIRHVFHSGKWWRDQELLPSGPSLHLLEVLALGAGERVDATYVRTAGRSSPVIQL